MTFKTCLIKKFWPAEDKGDEDEIIRQLVIQAEVALDNSRQVGELYNNMVRGLVRILFLDSLTGEELVLNAATIKPFNIKQKKVRVGKGEDADVVKSEFAALNIVTRIPDDNEGRLLAELYPFFNIEIQMTIEELKPFAHVVDAEPQAEALASSAPKSPSADAPTEIEENASHSDLSDDQDENLEDDDDLYFDEDDDLDENDENFINDSDAFDDAHPDNGDRY